MTSKDDIILVTGATGQQGGAVIRHMQNTGRRLRALTRNADSSAARALAEQGVEVVQGDMGDPSSLTKAMENAHGVFSVQDYWSVGAEQEIQQGKNMADAAKKAGVQHFVYSSVGAAERNSGIVHFDSKFVIEGHIRATGLPATILRPVGFMENFDIPHLKKGILKGKLAHPVAPDRMQQFIPTDDIGAFAAAAFLHPDKYLGLALEIASDECTGAEVAKTLAKVVGRPVRYKKMPMFLVRLFMGKELYQMFRWYNRHSFEADIPKLRSNFPEVTLTCLEDWLRREGWGAGS